MKTRAPVFSTPSALPTTIWMILAMTLAVLLGTSSAPAAEVTLTWDPVSHPDLEGYRLYYGPGPGNYDSVVDVGNTTAHTFTELTPGELYYFAATAYAQDQESAYSNEAVYQIPEENKPPVADAGPDQMVDEEELVTLNGSNSSDMDGGIATYEWIQEGGPPVTLSDPHSPTPAFTAPNVGMEGAAIIFWLTVTDTEGLESTDFCVVNVSWVNVPPIAHAGSDQLIDEHTLAELNAGESLDLDDGIAFYYWEQISGPAVQLSDPTAIVPSFVSPNVGVDGTSLTFELTVEDNGGLQSVDTCIVNVSWVNLPPVADAGPDQTVQAAGDEVRLHGENSADPDDGIAAYRWKQINGVPVVLSDANGIEPTFQAPAVPEETLVLFELTVTDAGGLADTDTCAVTLPATPQFDARVDIAAKIGKEEIQEVSTAELFTLHISIDAGNDRGMPADCWMFVETDFGRMYYAGKSGWKNNPRTLFKKWQLQDVGPCAVTSLRLFPGTYKFTLAVDDNADGIVDGTVSDTTVITVR